MSQAGRENLWGYIKRLRFMRQAIEEASRTALPARSEGRMSGAGTIMSWLCFRLVRAFVS